MPNLEYACERMRYWCDEGNLGYDQNERWDIWEGGESDCSSLVIHVLREAGFDTGDASYTGNLSDELCARGWRRLVPEISDARPGDILLNDVHHVCMVVDGYGWGATIGQASIDENGNARGGRAGDQTGYETVTKPIYVYGDGWDCILRYQGEQDVIMKPTQPESDPVNDAGMYYRAHVQDAGWFPAVRDGQIAGTVGESKRLEAIKLSPPAGWVLYAKAHIQDVGWVTYPNIQLGDHSGDGSSEHDPIIGTIGSSRRMEMLEIGVQSRPDGDNRHLKFRLQREEVGWTGWTPEGYASGADAISKRIEAIQIVVE